MTADIKKSMIAKIKIAQKQLGLEDGAYRDILKRVTGEDSSTKLDEKQLEAVINELKRYGFKPTAPAKYGRKPNIGKAHASRKVKVEKIEALLADMGKHWNYAHSIAKKVTKGEKEIVTFCSDEQLTKIISALTRTQQYQKKKQAKAETTGTT